jgi:hypothetical protein
VTQASAPASDSPVTRQTCGASPQPVTPSLSVIRTTSVSTVVVLRSAVTKAVCNGADSRVQVTEAITLTTSSAPTAPR